MRPPRAGFIRQTLRLAGPYWRSQDKWKVRGYTLLLFALTVGQVALAVWTNYWNRALFDAIENRSTHDILVQAGVFLLIFALTIGVTSAHLVVKRWLQLGWRGWLTERLVTHWMNRSRHYRLGLIPGEHDNPDGRIAEDVRITTETAIVLAHTLTNALLTLVLFIGILWEISGTVTLPGTSIAVPGYLVPLAFLYAGAGTLLGWLFGKPIVDTTNRLQTAEADFRFNLARERENSEAIALLHGEAWEREGNANRYREIRRRFDAQTLAYLGLVAFSTGYGTLLPVFPLLVAAPQYILGIMTLGVLMQAVQAFQNVASALSWPVNNLGEIARAKASAERVLTLYEGMRDLDAHYIATDICRVRVIHDADTSLWTQGLTLTDRAGQILIERLDIEIRRGEWVMLTGDPAVTSSLFKAIGGLWPWGSGTVHLPASARIEFLPQRPFLPEGTLHAALCYPHPPEACHEMDIRLALEHAGVAWLIPRLDETAKWNEAFPLRTQQRLGIARALLHHPDWIYMDETTNAFNPESEVAILSRLRSALPEATVLTTSFHPELEKLHDRKIVLTRIGETRYLDSCGFRP